MLPKKHLFDLPDDLVYLDGNSLGALPKKVAERTSAVIADQWGKSLIKSWNDHAWMQMPVDVGDRIGRLIGAARGSVVVGDTLSIKVYQVLSAALDMQSERRVVLSDSGNFPSDLYMAEGLLTSLGRGHELRIVAPEEVAGAIDESVAAVLLTEVDYCTGRRHDMREITRKAHEQGAMMIWDLAHSAGALHVDLAASKCDFAVGCTYKYLNGGPGAPAFVYIRPDLIERVRPCLSGWMGHAAPFAFDLAYTPAPSIERMRVGTPPILQLAALDEALKVWDGVSMRDVESRSAVLSELFISEVESACPMLSLASPRDPARRGSQVSFRFDHAYAAMQALISEGIIGDVRAPDILRFGFTPLYIDETDVRRACGIIVKVFRNERWRDYVGRMQARVT